MAQLTVQKVTSAGVEPVYTAADVAGDKFANTGRQVLAVKNGGASAITITVNSQRPCSYGFDHDLEITIEAGKEKIVGPFEPNRFNDAEQNVSVAYSDVTSVTVAVLSF